MPTLFSDVFEITFISKNAMLIRLLQIDIDLQTFALIITIIIIIENGKRNNVGCLICGDNVILR